jgi:hypothetical protein
MLASWISGRGHQAAGGLPAPGAGLCAPPSRVSPVHQGGRQRHRQGLGERGVRGGGRTAHYTFASDDAPAASSWSAPRTSLTKPEINISIVRLLWVHQPSGLGDCLATGSTPPASRTRTGCSTPFDGSGIGDGADRGPTDVGSRRSGRFSTQVETRRYATADGFSRMGRARDRDRPVGVLPVDPLRPPAGGARGHSRAPARQ